MLKAQCSKLKLGIGLWALCLVAALTSCGRDTPLLGNTYPSTETLATAVLDAVARRDTATLHELALNEQEFREHVWPELPASRPERNLPFSYVWGDLKQKSDASLTDTLATHGGRRYTLLSVRFGGEVTRYPSYTVHRDTMLKIRDDGGVESEVRLFGSTIEKDGAWKVFSYVADD